MIGLRMKNTIKQEDSVMMALDCIIFRKWQNLSGRMIMRIQHLDEIEVSIVEYVK